MKCDRKTIAVGQALWKVAVAARLRHTCLRGVDGKVIPVAEEVASIVLFTRAHRVRGLVLLGQGIQRQAVGVARSGETLWVLHAKIRFPRSLGGLLAVRDRRVQDTSGQVLGAVVILETTDKTFA